MPLSSTQALVLGSLPLKEQDKLIHLLSINRGILKAIAPGALKSKNRFGSLLEIFTHGHFFYYWNEEKEMVTISKGEIITSFFNLISKPENIFYFYLIAEIILKTIPPNLRDTRIFRLVRSILTARDKGMDMDVLLLYFQIWILRIEGLMFNPGLCYNCFSKNINKAWMKKNFRGIICARCKTSETNQFDESELEYIKWTNSNAPKKPFPRLSEINQKKMNRIFLKKTEYHAECTFKSKNYLSEFT
jgi:DNA repair protein RecO (recombination protein O)